MMKQKLGLLVLGAATFACSGRYYEVGADGVAGVGGTRGAAGGAAPGGSSSAVAGTSQVDPGVGAFAGTGNAGPSMPAGELCVPSGAPPEVTGPFAPTWLIMARISMLTWGETAPPHTQPNWPTPATYDWTGTAVTTELRDTKNQRGTAYGVELFLRQALGLDADATFSEPWGVVASTDNSFLNALLRAPLGEPGRVGIFTEPSWLEKRTTISARGAAIEDFLFARPIPSPPEGIENPKPNPNLSDRANLEASVSSLAPCTGCHQLMDPTGFALGNFASDGQYRELDHGLPVDTTGSRPGFEELVQFDGIADFGQKFENDCVAMKGIAAAFARAAGALNGASPELVEASIERIQQAFVNSDRTYEDLVRAYIQSPAGLRP